MRKISGLTARSPGLVIIDAQRIFLELKSPARLPDADAVTARILLLTAAFRAQGLPVVFTRHLERPESGRGTSATFFPRPLVTDDPMSAMTSALDGRIAPEDLFEKDRHDAFSRELPGRLIGVDVLFLAGVQTPLCVLSTALGLPRHGIVSAVVTDACAARNRQAHDAAIKCLASGHAHTLTTDEVLRLLMDGGRP